MTASIKQTCLTYSVAGRPVAALPRCAGVYRFISSDGQVLYIGKSIDVYARVRTHLNEARHSHRQHRMVSATSVVDCMPTAGEAGALLLENSAIKRELPLFNRRQRSVRRLWSILLRENTAGYEQPEIHSFSLDKPDIMAAYGSFKSRHHARESLQKLSRRESLCPVVLGLERSSGACFQHQIGRCHGACVGAETPVEHNARLRLALAQHRLSAWPVTGPIFLQETAQQPLSCQPQQQWHLLHNWTYLGTYDSRAAAKEYDTENGFMFDRDTYQILRRVLQKNTLPLLCAHSGAPILWPETHR